MRSLHLAALPFPTPQGTQGALHAMLDALATAGHDTHLLCYPELAAQSRLQSSRAPQVARRYRVHRADSLVARSRSSRSGPSLEKLWLDAALWTHARRLHRELAPDLVVAHHVEAALCGLSLGSPVLYLAHTSLGSELSSYFPAPLGRLARALGHHLDRFLCRSLPGVLAVSPLLASLLQQTSGSDVRSIVVPWEVPQMPTPRERTEARRHLQLSTTQPVALYAGNLDAYQGLEALFSPLLESSRRFPELVWLVATAAPSDAFERALKEHGLAARVRFAPLASEAERSRVHAAADLALVPRAAPGGLPIKLLEALSRGTPTVAARLACAGLSLPTEALEMVEDEPGSWERGIAKIVTGQPPDVQLARAYVAQAHAPTRFVSDLIAHAEREGLLRGANSRTRGHPGELFSARDP
jgi:glycosyltransferase involved in cell wall biosynthesis